MRRSITILLIMLSLMMLAGTWTGEPRVRVPVSYTEPSKNEDGSPLKDLKEIRIYRTINGGRAKKIATIPASSYTGGKTRKRWVTIAIHRNTPSKICIWAVAVDRNGNVSDRSNETCFDARVDIRNDQRDPG